MGNRFIHPFRREKLDVKKKYRDRFIDIEDLVLMICNKTNIRRADVREVVFYLYSFIKKSLIEGKSVKDLLGTHYTFKNKKGKVSAILKYKRNFIKRLNELIYRKNKKLT